MHLAVALPATGGGASRSGARPDAAADFAALARLARTAERGLFDFVLLDEGLRLPEHRGRVDGLAATGRAQALTVLGALAAVTEHVGLAAAADAAFHEPYELARRLATLDHLSGGRTAWHLVTTADARTGDNFRRDGSPDPAARQPRAAELVAAARRLWDSWGPDGSARPFVHHGTHFDIAGEFTLPRSPQGHPVVIRSGDGDEDREAAAATADVLLTRHAPPEAARALADGLRRRLAAHGRDPADLRIMPRITVVLGDTAAEARERAAAFARRRITPGRAIRALERLWGADLSAYDPDGPLPETDPRPGQPPGPDGAAQRADAVARAEKWRALSKEKGLSIRQTVIEARGWPSFAGTPDAVAAQLEAYARQDAADGFTLLPDPVSFPGPGHDGGTADGCGGLDEFVDRVVPLLQERGLFRAAYAGATLRSHLGLPDPAGPPGKPTRTTDPTRTTHSARATDSVRTAGPVRTARKEQHP
ncbi:NtaA/DmoA family FMN-dependent monooxygenase [Streptomyces sp. NPDC058417]|uniref:NtaA/DmoA family FMN-dependent monooxygenase n=1 Tax=unclassified Streptomyces TaxID=2593676 RepID=UPI00365A7754